MATFEHIRRPTTDNQTSVEDFLETPLSIFTHIRSKREAAVLLGVSRTARKFDELIRSCKTIVDSSRMLKDHHSTKCENAISALTPLFSLIGASNARHRKEIESDIILCRNAFMAQKGQLECFVESNLESSREFEEVEEFERARLKRWVADIESSLVSRIELIVGPTSPATEAGHNWA